MGRHNRGKKGLVQNYRDTACEFGVGWGGEGTGKAQFLENITKHFKAQHNIFLAEKLACLEVIVV